MKVPNTPYEVMINKEGTYTVFKRTQRYVIQGGAPVVLEVAGPFQTRKLAEDAARRIHRVTR
jgi:hypothetical protein